MFCSLCPDLPLLRCSQLICRRRTEPLSSRRKTPPGVPYYHAPICICRERSIPHRLVRISQVHARHSRHIVPLGSLETFYNPPICSPCFNRYTMQFVWQIWLFRRRHRNNHDNQLQFCRKTHADTLLVHYDINLHCLDTLSTSKQTTFSTHPLRIGRHIRNRVPRIKHRTDFFRMEFLLHRDSPRCLLHPPSQHSKNPCAMKISLQVVHPSYSGGVVNICASSNQRLGRLQLSLAKCPGQMRSPCVYAVDRCATQMY